MNKKNELKIAELLEYVVNNIPYYSNYFKNENIIKFEKMPIISKEIIQNNYDLFLSKKINWEKSQIQYTTGSTGKPLKCVKSNKEMFISEKKIWDWRSEWMENIIGKKLLVFSNKFSMFSELDEMFYENRKKTDDNGYYGKVKLKFITPRNVSELSVKIITDYINAYSPEWVIGAPSNVYEFCRKFRKIYKEGEKFFTSIKFIELSGESLEFNERKIIEEVFNCKVANHYGSREVWPIACECKEEKLHIFEEHVFCEVINSEKYGDKNIGELCITALNQKEFPIIRYNIGDIVEIKDVICKCGKKGKIVSSIKGRVSDMIKIDNNYYSSQIFSQLISDTIKTKEIEIRSFYVIQKSNYLFEIEIETEEFLNKDIESYMEKYVKENLSKMIKINIKCVKKIKDKMKEKKKFFHSEI